MLVPEEFWSSIGWRATESVQRLITAAKCAKPKVPNFDTRAARVEDIFCL